MNSKYYQISFETKKISRQRLADGSMTRVKDPISDGTNTIVVQLLCWAENKVAISNQP